MKTQRIAMLALAVAGTLSGAAFADPEGVTLYGVLDAGVGSVQHQGNTGDGFASTVNAFSPIKSTSLATGSAVNGVFNGGIQDSRWGLRGTEDLANGTKAIFAVESGINLPTGQLNNNDYAVAAGGTTNAANSSLSGQLFNRQAWIGLQDDDYGRLTLGRQYMPIYDILSRYDNVQFGQLLSPLSFSGGLGGGVGISEDMREDNSLKYSNTINGVNFGGLYRFGGISGHTGARSDYALNLGYEQGAFGIQAAYERVYDGIKASSAATTLPGNIGTLTAAASATSCGATTTAVEVGGKFYCPGLTTIVSNGINAQVYNSTGYMIALKYKFDELALTLRGGFSEYQLSNGDLSTSQMGLASLYGNTIANATTSNQVLKAGTTASTHIEWFGGDYQLNAANNLSVGLYNVVSSADAGYGKTSGDSGQAQYTARYYSFLYDHNLSKRTDLYAAAMIAQFSDFGPTLEASSTTPGFTTNHLLMVGMRTKF